MSSMNRELFPVASRYAYLNNACLVPPPRPVANAIVEFVEDIHGDGCLNAHLWQEKEEKCRSLLASLLNCESDEIALTKNASQGLILASESIPLCRGDMILINDLEFPSNVYPWDLVAKRRGAIVKTIRSAVGRITCEMIKKNINRQVKAVAISSVQYLNGYKADLEAIGKLCKQHGIYLIVDATHSTGVLDVDVKRWQASMVCGGSQTWLMSTPGLGYLYVNKNVMNNLSMANGGWKSVHEPSALSSIYEPAQNARRFEDGAVSTLGIHGLVAALELIDKTGIKNIESKVLALSDELVCGLENKGYRVVSSQHEGEKSAITLFRGGPFSSRMLKESLTESGVIVSQISQGIRVSPYFYNNSDDIAQLLNGLP